jgi:hypothetical protein
MCNPADGFRCHDCALNVRCYMRDSRRVVVERQLVKDRHQIFIDKLKARIEAGK